LARPLAGKAGRVNRRLAIYLNDHRAGSIAGTELAKRTLRENRGTNFEETLDWLLDQVLEDRATLERIMDELGIAKSRVKGALGFGLERIGRLKLNGQLTGYSPLSRLVELEGLSIGISGKLALWENLQAAADEEPRLRAFDFDQLTGRARSQLERLHGERLAAARLALR
jgi:hypothetical protein